MYTVLIYKYRSIKFVRIPKIIYFFKSAYIFTFMQLTLIRHGESYVHLKGAHQTFDDKLTIQGIKQLESTKIYETFDTICCSDMPRALETAKILFKNSQIKTDERLREKRNGIFEGVLKKDADWSEINKLPFLERKAPQGKNLLEVKNRILQFLRDLPEGKHAIISHGTVLRVMISLLLQIDLEELLKSVQIGHGSSLTLTISEDEFKKLVRE